LSRQRSAAPSDHPHHHLPHDPSGARTQGVRGRGVRVPVAVIVAVQAEIGNSEQLPVRVTVAV
jgi:hypothetical protein